jgi:CheY-like chemotaxis protein
MMSDRTGAPERQRKLLLIEPDQTSAAFMRHMLTRAGYAVGFAPGGKEGMIAAWRDQPDAVIIELDLPDLDGLEVIRRLRADPRTQKTWILCLTQRSAPEATQQAFELGVEEYIVKQTDAVDLVLRRLVDLDHGTQPERDGTSPLKPGRIVAFLGAKGGVGTSSLCLNFAHEIASLEVQRQSVVVDLVLPMGDLAAFSAADRSIDIVQLTSEPRGARTPSSLRFDLPRPNGWQFQLVPGASDPARSADLVPDRLAPLIQMLRSTYGRVYVDVGRNLSSLAMLILRQADVLVAVLTPVSSVLAHTASTLAYLRDEGIPEDRFYLLSNRPLGVEDLPLEEIGQVLDRPPDGSVPYLKDNMYISNLQGLPLRARFARSHTTRSLQETATSLASRVSQAVRAGA